MLQDKNVEPAPRSEMISPSYLPLLAPGERPAPIAFLSPSKRNALVACFNSDGLHKKDGAWHGAPGGKPISGSTTADLARDGMLTVTTKHRNGSARLTERGNWFARTQNGYAERLIGTIRRECLDHLIVLGEAHLRRIVGKYAAHYNQTRTHRSLDKDTPFGRTIERLSVVTSWPLLGGLHHQYCRI
jgi:hypothetical protein